MLFELEERLEELEIIRKNLDLCTPLPYMGSAPAILGTCHIRE